MTSAHSMFSRLLRSRRWRVRAHCSAVAALVAICLVACSSSEKLQKPAQLHAPYERPQVWAVVPFVNESGVSIVRSDRVADLFAQEAEQIAGIATIPVNRVLYAMRRLELRSVSTPADALALMNVLDVDGLIVGTVTAYDPYPPLKIGAAVQLFQRNSQVALATLDPVQVTRARNDRTVPAATQPQSPNAQASGMFDASNHQTLMWIDEYATGRSEPESAYGRRIYLVNMELYTQFVAHRLLHELLTSERLRLQAMTTQVNTR